MPRGVPGDMGVPTKYLPSCRRTTPFVAVAGFDGALELSAMAHGRLTRGLPRLPWLDVHFVNPSPVFCLDKTVDYGLGLGELLLHEGA